MQLPAGTACTGGATGNKCLVSFTTAGGFGNCVAVSQGAAAAAGNAAAGTAAAGTAATGTAATGTTGTTGTGKTGKGRGKKAAAAAAAAQAAANKKAAAAAAAQAQAKAQAAAAVKQGKIAKFVEEQRKASRAVVRPLLLSSPHPSASLTEWSGAFVGHPRCCCRAPRCRAPRRRGARVGVRLGLPTLPAPPLTVIGDY